MEYNNTVVNTTLCYLQISNKCHPQISAALELALYWRSKQFNNCQSAYSSKYNMYFAKNLIFLNFELLILGFLGMIVNIHIHVQLSKKLRHVKVGTSNTYSCSVQVEKKKNKSKFLVYCIYHCSWKSMQCSSYGCSGLSCISNTLIMLLYFLSIFSLKKKIKNSY